MAQNLTEDLNIVANSNLKIELLNGDLNIIQKLDDEPNDVGGLTSAELKAKFDEAGNVIKTYINDTLIPAILAEDATEEARASAEAAREAAEQARATAEGERAAAEQARVEAENGRASAEAARVTAEQERAAAEQARADENDGIVAMASHRAVAAAASASAASTEADLARSSANSALASANSAAASADAAETAKVAAETAQEAAKESKTAAAASAESAAASAKLAKPPKRVTITLSASGWDYTAKTQTVAVTGVSATETDQLITPVPALASQTAYYDAGIKCTGQAANSLTFTADTVPVEDLTVYVTIQEVSA